MITSFLGDGTWLRPAGGEDQDAGDGLGVLILMGERERQGVGTGAVLLLKA